MAFTNFFFTLSFLVFLASATVYEDSISNYNISSDLYINEEMKFNLNAETLTNTTTVSEKRIFSIQFDESKFCKNSYYTVENSEVAGISYGKNISNTDYLKMLTSIYIESSGVLLTLDTYMNLHVFKVSITGDYVRKYIQTIQPTIPSSYTAQTYSKAWIFYSKTEDVVVAYCKNFHYTIYLAKITASNSTNANLINVTDNLPTLETQYQKVNLLKVVQLTSNNSQFFLLYSNAFAFHKISKNSDSSMYLQEIKAQTVPSLIKDGSVSSLVVYILTGDAKISKYEYSLDSNQIDPKTDMSIPISFVPGASFLVSNIGSANSKVNDRVFFIGGQLSGLDYSQDDYCVAEFFVDSTSALVYNRHYCSNEPIQSIEVKDRFAFVQRSSIHQFLYHSIQKELLDNQKTQNYLISQQLMHYTLHNEENETDYYYIVAVESSNSYQISLYFIEEIQPKITCLADSSYGEGDYDLLYKVKASHCTSNKETNSYNGCKLYEKLKINLKEYSENSKTGLIVGVVIGCVVGMLIIIAFVYYCLHKKFEQKYEKMKEDYEIHKYQSPKQQNHPVKNEDVQLDL